MATPQCIPPRKDSMVAAYATSACVKICSLKIIVRHVSPKNGETPPKPSTMAMVGIFSVGSVILQPSFFISVDIESRRLSIPSFVSSEMKYTKF